MPGVRKPISRPCALIAWEQCAYRQVPQVDVKNELALLLSNIITRIWKLSQNSKKQAGHKQVFDSTKN